MKNNKGVTLVELLIVIVVMGIIAAFAVPSVQTIISNTQKSAVYADALAVEQAADLYCADTLCDSTASLTWGTLGEYLDGIDTTYYTLAATTVVAARTSDGPWTITLETASDNTGDWEFQGDTSVSGSEIYTPSLTDRDASVFAESN